jgi:PDZ domain-containing secreted protein
MVRTLGLAVGGLMLVIGVVWTLQGLDYLGGSSMSGDSTFAVVGPVVAVLGVVIGVVAARRRPPSLD